MLFYLLTIRRRKEFLIIFLPMYVFNIATMIKAKFLRFFDLEFLKNENILKFVKRQNKTKLT